MCYLLMMNSHRNYSFAAFNFPRSYSQSTSGVIKVGKLNSKCDDFDLFSIKNQAGYNKTLIF